MSSLVSLVRGSSKRKEFRACRGSEGTREGAREGGKGRGKGKWSGIGGCGLTLKPPASAARNAPNLTLYQLKKHRLAFSEGAPMSHITHRLHTHHRKENTDLYQRELLCLY